MWLIFGFAGFNAASQLTISQPGDGYVVARATFNTFLACSSGGISSVIFIRFLPWWGRRWSYVNMVNGALSGMVYYQLQFTFARKIFQLYRLLINDLFSFFLKKGGRLRWVQRFGSLVRIRDGLSWRCGIRLRSIARR